MNIYIVISSPSMTSIGRKNLVFDHHWLEDPHVHLFHIDLEAVSFSLRINVLLSCGTYIVHTGQTFIFLSIRREITVFNFT